METSLTGLIFLTKKYIHRAVTTNREKRNIFEFLKYFLYVEANVKIKVTVLTRIGSAVFALRYISIVTILFVATFMHYKPSIQ